MSATDQDIRALEHLALRLRQDTHGCKVWDAEGTHAVFARELLGKQLAYAVEQVLHHACDPNAKTPAAITRNFIPDLPTPAPFAPPKRAEECPHHPGQRATSCGGCAADRLAGDPAPVRHHVDPETAARGAAACRAALAQARHDAEEAK